LNAIFSQNEIDGVIHLAAKKSVDESVSDPCIYYEENVVKTKILMDSMVENNIDCLVFSSTAAVYGNVEMEVIDEKYPTAPINPYGKTKLASEYMMRDYSNAYDFKYCSLRYFNVAGADPTGEMGFAGKAEKSIMPLLMKALRCGSEFIVFGEDYETRDGTCIRDYVHVMDLAEAHLSAYEYLTCNSRTHVFNLGSEREYSILELIKEAERVTNKKVKFSIGPRREGDLQAIIASNEKAKNLLGWEPKYSAIEDIIRDSYNWDINRKY